MNSLLIHGGPIHTMNPTQPIVDAVGTVGTRVVATGTLDDVTSALGSQYDQIDLAGRTAIPAFHDAHAHIMGVGFNTRRINVSPDAVDSIDDIKRLVRERAASTPDGGWIEGRGYDQAWLADHRMPNRHDLDEAAPNHPVLIQRSCGHIVAVNSKALELAGIDRNMQDPSDGTIDRDEHGDPTGVLRESAFLPVYRAKGDPTEDAILEAIDLGGMEFRKHGVTSAAEAGIHSAEEFRAYQRAHDSGRLRLRTWLMMMIDETLDALISLGITTGFGDEWMRIGNAKLFVDGSIGGRTARMTIPYEGEEKNVGLWMYDPAEITDKLLRAHKAGFQVGNHAIGDAAIDLLLDTYERAQREHHVDDPRFRIEHCSIVREDMLPRIAQLGAVPIPGTTFLYDMRPVYLENLGEERVRYAYAMNTFQQHGIVAAASTDAPVSVVNPMHGIHFMVNRADRANGVIHPQERISLDDALKAYTWNSAYSTFSEHEKGSLAPGMLADITVLETDLHRLDPMELRNIRTDITIADGAVVWERNSA